MGIAKPMPMLVPEPSPPVKIERVDSDHLTARIDERTARFAGVDGGVGLDHVVEDLLAVFLLFDVAMVGTDYADGDGRLRVGEIEAERASDRDGPLADQEVVGIAERRGLEIVAVELDECEVVAGRTCPPVWPRSSCR